MSKEKLDKLKGDWGMMQELQSIANSLHRLNEAACNYGLTKRQTTRETNLEVKAAGLANQLGVGIYFQGDPRGLSLYLVPKEWDRETKQKMYYPHGLGL